MAPYSPQGVSGGRRKPGHCQQLFLLQCGCHPTNGQASQAVGRLLNLVPQGWGHFPMACPVLKPYGQNPSLSLSLPLNSGPGSAPAAFLQLHKVPHNLVLLFPSWPLVKYSFLAHLLSP